MFLEYTFEWNIELQFIKCRIKFIYLNGSYLCYQSYNKWNMLKENKQGIPYDERFNVYILTWIQNNYFKIFLEYYKHYTKTKTTKNTSPLKTPPK